MLWFGSLWVGRGRRGSKLCGCELYGRRGGRRGQEELAWIELNLIG
jgi:hypothetical protein